MKLGDRYINADGMPYIIAEVGVNHEGSMDKAKELIELAKIGGAHSVKFQSYKAGTLASKHSPSYWDTTKEPTRSQFELFQKYDRFGESEYIALAEHCKKIGIDFSSTPFDDKAIDFLDPLMPFYKIASADITNTPFLRKIAAKKKPVLLSTGASNLLEIEKAVQELINFGTRREEICLLHCVLNYPTPDTNAHLNMILGLKKHFPDMLIGYSDHTLPDECMLNLTAAYLKGAMVIEKHFTHDKTLPGNDHYHAMDVLDLKRFRQNLQKLLLVAGRTDKAPLEDEELSRLNARRSIVSASSIKKGQVITEEVITYKRPQHGISPEHWDNVIGQVAQCDIEEDVCLKWEFFSSEQL